MVRSFIKNAAYRISSITSKKNHLQEFSKIPKTRITAAQQSVSGNVPNILSKTGIRMCRNCILLNKVPHKKESKEGCFKFYHAGKKSFVSSCANKNSHNFRTMYFISRVGMSSYLCYYSMVPLHLAYLSLSLSLPRFFYSV